MEMFLFIVSVVIYIIVSSKQAINRQHKEWLEEQHEICHCQPHYVHNKKHGKYVHNKEEILQ